MFVLTVGLTIYVRYKQIEQYYREELTPESAKIFCRNKIGLVCGLLSSIGLSMVANFRELELFKIHMIGATLAFGFGTIYCWIQTIMSFSMYPLVNTKAMAIFRFSLSSLMTCTFITTCICGPMAMQYFNGKDPTNWRPDDGGFGLHLTSTICEWITAMSIDFFVLSYVTELQVFIKFFQFSILFMFCFELRTKTTTNLSFIRIYLFYKCIENINDYTKSFICDRID